MAKKVQEKKEALVENHAGNDWTFLTNHSHVLICLNRDKDTTLKEVAVKVGITERAVLSILKDLVDSGVVKKKKEGRQNHYEINMDKKLRHPVEWHKSIGDLLDLMES